MPSPLHGLNLIEPYPASSHTPEQLPPDFAAQLDFWSTLNFNNIDDGLPAGGFGGSFPGGAQVPSTLDDLVRLGEEELQQPGAFGTVDPFLVAPQRDSPPTAKRARTTKASMKQEPSARSAAAESAARTTAAAAALADDDSDYEGDDSPKDEKTGLTPVTVVEDKRRRNTAASARFRAKKKEREQALEKRAKDLETRVTELERECEGLRRENGWLKGLVVGVTQAGGELNVAGLPKSLTVSDAPTTIGSKRKRD